MPKNIEIREELCPQNHKCPVSGRCPFGAIVQDNSHSAPYIVEEKCRNCGMCTNFCHVFQSVPA